MVLVEVVEEVEVEEVELVEEVEVDDVKIVVVVVWSAVVVVEFVVVVVEVAIEVVVTDRLVVVVVWEVDVVVNETLFIWSLTVFPHPTIKTVDIIINKRPIKKYTRLIIFAPLYVYYSIYLGESTLLFFKKGAIKNVNNP